MSEISKAFDGSERIGVIGSPSSTSQLTIDILGTAVDKRLVGTLSVFKFHQDGKDTYTLGQITEIKLRNVWSEDPTMRGLIRQKGRVDPVTERQDTHTASMTVSTVLALSTSTEGSVLGTVPATGTSVRLITAELMNVLLKDYLSQLFCLGYAYGTELLLPLWLKHFGKGGADEAYHIGIFGKTGSGKSVLSKMMMVGYSLHPEMSLIVLDPQGEFSKLKEDSKVVAILNRGGQREVSFHDLHDLVVNDDSNFTLFLRILRTTEFYTKLAIYADENKDRAESQIRSILKRKQQLLTGVTLPAKPWDLYRQAVFDYVWDQLVTPQVLANIYSGQEYQDRVRNAHRDWPADEAYTLVWSRVARLFAYDGKTKAVKSKDFVGKGIGTKSNIAIIDLSETQVPESILWNDSIRLIVINHLLLELTTLAEQTYKGGRLLNTLVVIDEAHRLAPRDTGEDLELGEVKRTLVDACRTTRKYGLGWLFISQSLSALEVEIIRQLRIYIFGFGLGWGAELRALTDLIGGNEEAIKLYQLFKDPQAALGNREYSFMTWGPISPLSFSGAPLFFTALDYPTDFMKANSFDEK